MQDINFAQHDKPSSWSKRTIKELTPVNKLNTFSDKTKLSQKASVDAMTYSSVKQ